MAKRSRAVTKKGRSTVDISTSRGRLKTLTLGEASCTNHNASLCQLRHRQRVVWWCQRDEAFMKTFVVRTSRAPAELPSPLQSRATAASVGVQYIDWWLHRIGHMRASILGRLSMFASFSLSRMAISHLHTMHIQHKSRLMLSICDYPTSAPGRKLDLTEAPNSNNTTFCIQFELAKAFQLPKSHRIFFAFHHILNLTRSCSVAATRAPPSLSWQYSSMALLHLLPL